MTSDIVCCPPSKQKGNSCTHRSERVSEKRQCQYFSYFIYFYVIITVFFCVVYILILANHVFRSSVWAGKRVN